MKRSYKILVLTDHSGHSEHNSIYSILSQMHKNDRVEEIFVASRGLVQNDAFYQEMNADQLWAAKIDDTFEYTAEGSHYEKALVRVQPEDFDVVFMRLPRPISDEFLLWLAQLFSHAVMVNNPRGIIATSTKAFLLNFPDLCPNMRLCKSVADIREELAKYPIVLKPLKEYGGRGLLKIDQSTVDDGNEDYDTERYLDAMQEDFTEEGYLSMKYLENVDQGDKRILVVDNKILAASLRIPAAGSWLCNVAQGGTSVAAEVTDEERKIVAALSDRLHDEGILIYGVDTLVNDEGLRVLSEINTLSIGGFPQSEKQTGKPIINILIDNILAYADERTK